MSRDKVLQLLEAGTFNWREDSWAVARYCPEKLDPDRYNWKEDSWAVARYCPEKLDPERYNWNKNSWAVARYCSDKLDPDRYNWNKKYSWEVAQYCPELFVLRHSVSVPTLSTVDKGMYLDTEILPKLIMEV